MTKTFDIVLPTLFEGQRAVRDSAARFKVVAAGRRLGKTSLGIVMAWQTALRGKRVWWVAPTYKLALEAWRTLQRTAAQIPGTSKNITDKSIMLANGGMLEVRSADDPDSLRGVGLDLLIVDEAAMIKEEAWQAALRPTLSGVNVEGKALFLSTPKGFNWFKVLFDKGIDPLFPEWQSWQMPSNTSPYMRQDEFEAARAELPERTFNQEYLATFVDNEGAVFRNIGACTQAPSEWDGNPHRVHRKVAGVDWGMVDSTAISIGCADCQVELELDRFSQTEWELQYMRIAALFEKWGVEVGLIEFNSIGSPGFSNLQRRELPVMAFTTTAKSKPPLIENMALAFERKEWQFQPDAVGRAELEAYMRHVNVVTGRSTYSAPDGQHDDTVMARALMLRAATQPRSTQVNIMR